MTSSSGTGRVIQDVDDVNDVMNWDEVKELAPLYAIGALDAETARAVEASMHDASPEQMLEVAQWRDLAALLPQALPDQTPPDSLRERLLNRIASEPQATPVEIAAAESTIEEVVEMAVGQEDKLADSEENKQDKQEDKKEDIQDIQEDNKVLPFIPPRRIESRPARWLLIAAMALLAFTSAYLYGQNAKLAREREEISRERDDLKRRFDEFVSPTTKVIAMVGDEVPQANAKVVWDTKKQQWVIYIFNLPAPPTDKMYQLWFVTNGAPIPADLFSTDTQGRTVLRLELPPRALAGLTATAVTLEPKGGSARPTSNFYLKARI